MDTMNASAQVQTYVESPDSYFSTREENMSAVVDVYEQMDWVQAGGVTRDNLQGLSIADRGVLFEQMAARLDAYQLSGVCQGLDDPAHVAELQNAVQLFSPYDVSESFFTGAPVFEIRELPQADANQEREQFMAGNLPSGQGLRGDAAYRLFSKNPQVMVQPDLNAHYRAHGDEPRQMAGREQLCAEVVRAADWPAGEGRLTQDQQHALDQVADKVIAIGGNKPAVTVLPVYFALEGEAGGILKTPLFRVESADGVAHFVDMQGWDFESLDDYRNNNNLPPAGSKLAMPADGRLELDALGNVKVFTGDARVEGAFEEFRRTTHADLVVGVGAAMAGAALVSTGLGVVPVALMAKGAAGFMVAQGTLAAAGVYGTVVSVQSLASEATHGVSVNPIKRPAAGLEYLNVGLNLAGAAELGVVGRGAVSLFTPGVRASLLAGNGVALGGGAYELATQWAQLSPQQREEHAVLLALNAAGLGVNALLPRFVGAPDPTPASGARAPLSGEAVPTNLQRETQHLDPSGGAPQSLIEGEVRTLRGEGVPTGFEPRAESNVASIWAATGTGMGPWEQLAPPPRAKLSPDARLVGLTLTRPADFNVNSVGAGAHIAELLGSGAQTAAQAFTQQAMVRVGMEAGRFTAPLAPKAYAAVFADPPVLVDPQTVKVRVTVVSVDEFWLPPAEAKVRVVASSEVLLRAANQGEPLVVSEPHVPVPADLLPGSRLTGYLAPRGNGFGPDGKLGFEPVFNAMDLAAALQVQAGAGANRVGSADTPVTGAFTVQEHGSLIWPEGLPTPENLAVFTSPPIIVWPDNPNRSASTVTTTAQAYAVRPWEPAATARPVATGEFRFTNFSQATGMPAELLNLPSRRVPQ